MAAEFDIDPDSAQQGLNRAGDARARMSASGVPLPPAPDQYTAAFFTAATGLLEAAVARVSSRTAMGQAATATTVAAVEGTETANANTLRL